MKQNRMFGDEGGGDPEGDGTSARNARDEAIERVNDNAGEEFSLALRRLVFSYPPGRIFMGEDLRLEAEAAGIVAHHPNAWGGAMSGLSQSGMIRKTGVYRQPKSVASHACVKAEWVRI